ncbi:MAG: prepilin peptidase [Phycisphaerae bacterium]|nr:prepilin peptidase [Phycisphaerae bacterium]
MIPSIIWIIFLFLLGACVGSFLNVVVYRMPREISLVYPPSRCPNCDRNIPWYDNIPIVGWFILKGKCRQCKQPFSFRYPLFELLTALIFTSLFCIYFKTGIRENIPLFEKGGYIVYFAHIFVISVLLASSLIDAEHWIIPLGLSYSMAIVGVIAAGMASMSNAFGDVATRFQTMPYVNPANAAIAFAALVGIVASVIMVKIKWLDQSFMELEKAIEQMKKDNPDLKEIDYDDLPIEVNFRREMVREIIFLSPAIVLSAFAIILCGDGGLCVKWWQGICESNSWLPGVAGSVFGFMIGGAVVWATRILGTLAFNREAMGLGDVHLMAGVGAVLGWQSPTIAFFIAPFFGLAWAIGRLVLKGHREIPYGPFLSMATVIVMIFHDPIMKYCSEMLFPGK